MSFGKQFLSAVIAEGSVADYLAHGSIDHLFKANEVPTAQFVREFVKKYSKLPDPDTIEAHLGEELVPHIEPAEYYLDFMQNRHIEYVLKATMKEVQKLLSPEHKDPQGALLKVTEEVMQLIARRNSAMVVDFREAHEIVLNTYATTFKDLDKHGLHLGWPTLDKMSGGLVKGDMTSMVGRPAKGKTWQMLYGCMSGWKASGINPGQSRMFVSMEMGALPIQQRLAAMQTHVPMSKLKSGGLGTVSLNKLKKGLIEVQGYGSPFYVVDGNLTATVEDIWVLARQLKPDAIFIDGAYLIKHPTERDRFRRVAENADLIKSELASLAPVVCSWQFSRDASKKAKKKGGDEQKVSIDDIGYTDAIGQVSSLVLGLFEEDNVETLQSRRVEILKGRNGEVGHFSTHWNFENMIFDEIVTETIEDLSFI